MRRLFNNTNATKKNPGTSSNPIFPKINIAAKTTKRNATANAMFGKNPYALLGLNSKTLVPEDFNSTVKGAFDKLLRAKKSKDLTPANNAKYDKKLAELRQARDFLLNTNLREGLNSRLVNKQTANNAIHKQRSTKTTSNILNYKNANGANIQKLFNNTNSTKKNPDTSNELLVQTMNQTAKTTNRKANAMIGKNPYTLIGLNSKKINPNTLIHSNTEQLPAEQSKEPTQLPFTSGQSTEIGTGKSFSNHIKQPINGPTKQEEKNATNALLFG